MDFGWSEIGCALAGVAIGFATCKKYGDKLSVESFTSLLVSLRSLFGLRK